MYKFSVSSDRIQKTPVWDEGQDVPYSANNARIAATKEIQKLLPDSSDYELDMISLEKTVNRWFYAVQFLNLKKNPSGPITPFVVVILLDGTVVEPVVSPL